MSDPRNFNTRTYQTITGLRTHPVFKQLTAGQQAFLVEFLKTGDRVAAVKAAGYQVRNDKSASTIAARLLRQPAIQSLLALYNDYQEIRSAPLSKRELAVAVSNRLIRRDTSSAAFTQLATLLAQLSGWTNEPVPEAEPNIDALVREMEKQNGKRESNPQRQVREAEGQEGN